MISKCDTCDKRILSHSKFIKCCICESAHHISCINRSNAESDTLNFSTTWTCLTCNLNSFPFNHIVTDTDFRGTLCHFFNDFDDSDLNLSTLIFNPFEINDSDDTPSTFDIDPDINFFNELSEKLVRNSNYYNENSFNNPVQRIKY